MIDKKLFEFLNNEVPSSVSEIREALDLLASSIESSIDQVAEKANMAFKNRDFVKVTEFSTNSESLNEASKKIQELVLSLDTLIDEREIEELPKHLDIESTEKLMPNYSDYMVDPEVEYTLYEDFTHKRPCAVKIENAKVDVRDWKDVLLKTMDYLAKKDSSILKKFPDNPKMNGKKVVYFSRVELPNMRAPRKLDSCDLYIETNLSANGIRNIVSRALNQYNIRLNTYKVYLKADYSELHK